MVLVKDKYDRVVDESQSRESSLCGEGYYVKIFHPDYCRLQNFKDVLSSGFLNGLAPALSHILEDDNGNINGYITLSGEMLSESEFDFQSIPNCSQEQY